MLHSKANNPMYRFTNTTEAFSIGETLASYIAFGDVDEVTVRRDLVVYFFGRSTPEISYYRASSNFRPQRMNVFLLGLAGQGKAAL